MKIWTGAVLATTHVTMESNDTSLFFFVDKMNFTIHRERTFVYYDRLYLARASGSSRFPLYSTNALTIMVNFTFHRESAFLYYEILYLARASGLTTK